MSSNSELSERMKTYETVTRFKLMRRGYTIVRCDGRSFHTYTKGLNRPFDHGLINDMDRTAIALCEGIQGAKMAYIQSDEISVVITDFEDITTQAWFDNTLQKMCSISASIATATFNECRVKRYFDENYINGFETLSHGKFPKIKLAQFDSRVFQVPTATEVDNYLIWRQQDTVRNSIQSVAQFLYSHKQLENKNSSDLQEMIFQKGINWNDYAPKYKRGRVIRKETKEIREGVFRGKWVVDENIPIFTQDRAYIHQFVPQQEM